ncbi:MAG: hypothetical protein HY696_00320 [Deltaproteobacteria bacterium]|nr:hypothetical protein [Deltaproteobacteria bacterium]
MSTAEGFPVKRALFSAPYCLQLAVSAAVFSVACAHLSLLSLARLMASICRK